MHGFSFPVQKSLISLLIDKYPGKKIKEEELCVTKSFLSFANQAVFAHL